MSKDIFIKKALTILSVLLFFGLAVLSSTAADIKPTDTSVQAMYSGTLGKDGWYVTPVSVDFFVASEDVDYIEYQIDNGVWEIYGDQTVTIPGEGVRSFSWKWYTKDGTEMEGDIRDLSIDTKNPMITLSRSFDESTQTITISGTTNDDGSGLHEAQYYINGKLYETLTEEPAIFTYYFSEPTATEFKVIAYDVAGHIHEELLPIHQLSYLDESDDPLDGGEDPLIDDPEPELVYMGNLVGDWFISCVSFSFVWDPEIRVDHIEYMLDNQGSWQTFVDAVTICDDGPHSVIWRWVDFAGKTYVPSVPNFDFQIDKTAPTILLKKSVGFNKVTYTAEVDDYSPGSGVDYVEFYLNNELATTLTEEPFEYELEDYVETDKVYAIVFDVAKHYAQSEELESSDTSISSTASSVNMLLESPTAASPLDDEPNLVYMGNLVGDWFISSVTISFVWDPEIRVDHIEYKLDNQGSWQVFSTAFSVSSDGPHSVIWRWVDFAGKTYVPSVPNFDFQIDKTAPTILLKKSVGFNKVTYTAEVDDYSPGSGVDYVEFYLNGALISTVTAEPYEYVWQDGESTDTMYAIVYDKVNHSTQSEILESVTFFWQPLQIIWDWLCQIAPVLTLLK